jgi:hypothetical protein
MAEQSPQGCFHINVSIAFDSGFQASKSFAIAHAFVSTSRSVYHFYPAITIKKSHLNDFTFGAYEITVFATGRGLDGSASGSGEDHGSEANKGTIKKKGARKAPLSQCLTEGSAAIGIGEPFPLALAGMLRESSPLLRQLFGFNQGASRHMNGATERGDGPLIRHGTIEIPSFGDVQQSGHFQGAGVSSTHAHLDGEGLVPVRHGHGDTDGVEPFENGVSVGGGELLNCVGDAGHGLKDGGSSRLRSTNNKLKPAPLACLSQSFTNGHFQSSALLHCTTFSLGPASSWAVRRACATLQAISSMQPLVVAMVYHSGLFAGLLMVWGSILGEQCLQSRKCGA